MKIWGNFYHFSKGKAWHLAKLLTSLQSQFNPHLPFPHLSQLLHRPFFRFSLCLHFSPHFRPLLAGSVVKAVLGGNMQKWLHPYTKYPSSQSHPSLCMTASSKSLDFLHSFNSKATPGKKTSFNKHWMWGTVRQKCPRGIKLLIPGSILIIEWPHLNIFCMS